MDKNDLLHQLTRVSDEVQSCSWLEFIFGKKPCDLNKPSWKDVLRVCTQQWDVMDYARLWDAFGSFCYTVATLAGNDVIESWRNVDEALAYVRFMITPNELNWYPLENLVYKDEEVRGEFAWFLYKAAGQGKDMANLYRYMYQLDPDTSVHVYVSSAEHIWDSPLERELTMTEFCRVFNPVRWAVNVDCGPYVSRAEPLLDRVQAASIWTFTCGDTEYGFEDCLGFSPLEISKGDIPDDLFDDWFSTVEHWRDTVDCMLRPSPAGVKYGTGAKTYKEFCHRAYPIDADRISFYFLQFVDVVKNIFDWWYRLNCKPRCVEHAGGFVVGTMEESDLMRSWLE